MYTVRASSRVCGWLGVVLALLLPVLVQASDSTDTLDRWIAEAEQKYQEGARYLPTVKADAKQAHDAAQQLLFAQQDLNDFKAKTVDRYQKNAAKVQAKLGLAIAMAAPSLLNPGTKVSDLAITAFQVFVADRALDKAAEWAGINDPITVAIKGLGSVDENSFKSLRRIDIVLRTPARTDAEVLDKDRELSTLASAAVDEVSGNRSTLLASYQRLKDLAATVEGQLAKLKADIERMKRHRDRVNDYDSAYKDPPPAPTESAYQSADDTSYGAAAGEMEAAWNELASNTIDGRTYSWRVSKAISGAGKHMGAVLKPYYDRCSAAYDRCWHCEETRAVCRAASAASQREWDAYSGSVTAKQKELTSRWRRAGDDARAWNERANKWNSGIPITYFSIDSEGVQTREYEIGPYNGDSYASVAWNGLYTVERYLRYNSTPTLWVDRTTPKYLEQWAQSAEFIHRAALEVQSGSLSQDTRAAGVAAEADRLASDLQPNVELWSYVYGCFYSSCRNSYRMLSVFADAYRDESQQRQKRMGEVVQQLGDIAQQTRDLSKVAKQIPQALDTAVQTLKAMDTAVGISRRGNLDPAGVSLWQSLSYNKVTKEQTKALLDARKKLTKEDDLLEKALKLFRGGYRWGYLKDEFPTPDSFKAVKESLKRTATAITATRESYTAAYNDYHSGMQSLEQQVKSMTREAEKVAQGASGRLSVEAFLQDARREVTVSNIYSLNTFLSDPAQMGDPTLGIDPLLKQYEAASKAYWDPLLVALERVAKGDGPEVKKLDKLTTQVRGQGMGWLRSGESTWNARIGEVQAQVKELYDPAYQENRVPYGSPIQKSYASFNRAVGEVTSVLYEQRRIRNLLAKLGEVRATGEGGLQAKEEAPIRSAIAELRGTVDANGDAQRSAAKNAQVASLVKEIEALIPRLEARIVQLQEQQRTQLTADIQRFYDDFARAYSDRDTMRVISMLADDWESGDGSTIGDVEEILDNSFRMFDEVQYRMSGLRVSRMGNGNYQVSYSSTITGRIYRMDMVHKEENTVSEVVGEVDGKLRILRTLSGRYWMR